MKKFMLLIVCMTTLFIVGCAQQYYLKSNLNHISLGQTKERILSTFPGHQTLLSGNIPGMEMRAAQRSSNGKLIEVGEVLLTDGVTPTVSHWFMFEEGLLVQWGRPEDWKKVSARYEINFNPSPSVPLN